MEHQQEVERFCELAQSLHQCAIALMQMLANPGENARLDVVARVTKDEMVQLVDIAKGFHIIALTFEKIINDPNTQTSWLQWSPDERMHFCKSLLARDPERDDCYMERFNQ